eukprot:gene54924-20178_t
MSELPRPTAFGGGSAVAVSRVELPWRVAGDDLGTWRSVSVDVVAGPYRWFPFLFSLGAQADSGLVIDSGRCAWWRVGDDGLLPAAVQRHPSGLLTLELLDVHNTGSVLVAARECGMLDALKSIDDELTLAQASAGDHGELFFEALDAHQPALAERQHGAPSLERVLKFNDEVVVDSIMLGSDGGGEFTGSDYTTMCEEFSIQKFVYPAEHPDAHGIIERFNRTLQETFNKINDDTPCKTLADYSTVLLTVYNEDGVASMRREGDMGEQLDLMDRAITAFRSAVCDRNLRKLLVQPGRQDRLRPRSYTAGDYVWYRREPAHKGDNPFRGPAKVIGATDHNVYVIHNGGVINVAPTDIRLIESAAVKQAGDRENVRSEARDDPLLRDEETGEVLLTVPEMPAPVPGIEQHFTPTMPAVFVAATHQAEPRPTSAGNNAPRVRGELTRQELRKYAPLVSEAKQRELDEITRRGVWGDEETVAFPRSDIVMGTKWVITWKVPPPASSPVVKARYVGDEYGPAEQVRPMRVTYTNAQGCKVSRKLRKALYGQKDAPRRLQEQVRPKGLQEQVRPKGLQEQVRPKGLQEQVRPKGLQEQVRPKGLQEQVRPKGLQEQVRPKGLQDGETTSALSFEQRLGEKWSDTAMRELSSCVNATNGRVVGVASPTCGDARAANDRDYIISDAKSVTTTLGTTRLPRERNLALDLTRLRRLVEDDESNFLYISTKLQCNFLDRHVNRMYRDYSNAMKIGNTYDAVWKG